MTTIQEVAPGKLPAEASLWRIYFPLGQTPSESAVRRALGATRAVKTTQMTTPSVVSYDASVDSDMVEILPPETPVHHQAVIDEPQPDEFEENIELVLRQREVPTIVEVSDEDSTATNNESEQ